MPKGEAVVAEISGTVRIIQSEKYADMRLVKIEHSELVSDTYDIPEEWKVVVKTRGGSQGRRGAGQTGRCHHHRPARRTRARREEDRQVVVAYDQREEKEEEIPTTSRLLVRDGDKIEAGEPLTEGSLNPHRILRIHGREACELYLLGEVQKVYRSQGQNIHDKHFEVIIRKMMSKVQVTRPGDTKYLPGDPVDRLEIRRVNEALLAEGKQPRQILRSPAGRDQGLPQHRLVPLGLLLPAHHQSAGGRGHRLHDRPALRSERERDHRQAHPAPGRASSRVASKGRLR